MTALDRQKMTRLVNRAKRKGFEVDDVERIIYYDYLKPETIENKLINNMREKYNFRCHAQLR